MSQMSQGSRSLTFSGPRLKASSRSRIGVIGSLDFCCVRSFAFARQPAISRALTLARRNVAQPVIVGHGKGSRPLKSDQSGVQGIKGPKWAPQTAAHLAASNLVVNPRCYTVDLVESFMTFLTFIMWCVFLANYIVTASVLILCPRALCLNLGKISNKR